ncbi:DUF3265 domain-containing protein [Vibrio vulnificus]|nr:DUF3265 domain-containing protein [Vibrio vulnificus]MCA3908282.1 DUF3265 domain-containing protein [Vibrio vulnificus]HAS8474994.1 DUF3265 domain-containing protein [Vibrio vulnificus]
MQAHNKALKRDSCRVAFLVCGDFCGENGLRKAGLCGTHPLTRRYTAISHLTFSWLYGKHRYVRAFQLLGRLQ